MEHIQKDQKKVRTPNEFFPFLNMKSTWSEYGLFNHKKKII